MGPCARCGREYLYDTEPTARGGLCGSCADDQRRNAHKQGLFVEVRNRELVEMAQAGVSGAEVARRYGVSSSRGSELLARGKRLAAR